MLRMVKAPYRRALLPVTDDPATRFVHLAGWYLLHGEPRKAIAAFQAGALYAQTEAGARELRQMAGELAMGLLTGETVQ